MTPTPGFYRDPANEAGYRYWDGGRWGQVWEAPHGYYRPLPLAPIRYWDGHRWGQRYWSWWRISATATIAVVAFFVEVALTGGMLGDPGPGGDTPEFERTKALAALLLPVGAVFFSLLMIAVHWGWLGTRRRVARTLESYAR